MHPELKKVEDKRFSEKLFKKKKIGEKIKNISRRKI